MKMENGRYVVYGNALSESSSRKATKWQEMFVKKFKYDPDEKYTLSLRDNPYGSSIFGLKDILRGDEGEPIQTGNAVICSTIRMGFGHYRIAMAGASCARAMGFTPYWLDMLAIPGITTDVINWCNSWYSRWSRISQRSELFNKYVLVDIEAHVFMDLHVLVPDFGCFGCDSSSSHTHADRFPSQGATRVTGDKHTFLVRGLSTQL